MANKPDVAYIELATMQKYFWLTCKVDLNLIFCLCVQLLDGIGFETFYMAGLNF